MMITDADIEKLLAVRSARPTVLSLYLEVPSHPPAMRSLPARADELISEGAQADRNDAGQACGDRELGEDRSIVRRMLEVHARDWPGRSVAIFACGEPCLAEPLVLPSLAADRAVLATRPHVRPLLVAQQRCRGYYLAVVDRHDAWVFRATEGRIERLTLPAGVRIPGLGGWYGLEAHRVRERITALAGHPYADVAAALGRLMTGGGPEPLVVGGCQKGVRQFLAALPDDTSSQVIASFAADPHAVTLAQMAELASQAARSWSEEREQRAVTEAGQARDDLNATGLQVCLAAVNVGAAGLLIVPEDGLVPGFVCQRCGKLSETGTDCPDWGAASMAVPDLVEEMVVQARHDGALVETVREPPGGIMARLRFPLSCGEAAGDAAYPTGEAVGSVRA